MKPDNTPPKEKVKREAPAACQSALLTEQDLVIAIDDACDNDAALPHIPDEWLRQALREAVAIARFYRRERDRYIYINGRKIA